MKQGTNKQIFWFHGALSDSSVCSMHSFCYSPLGIPVLYPVSVYYPSHPTNTVMSQEASPTMNHTDWVYCKIAPDEPL